MKKNPDIDALAAFLLRVRNGDDPWCDPDQAKDWSRALTALVAERDELKKRVAELEKELKSRNEAYEELRWRIVEKSWSQPPPDRDRDLRERLIVAVYPILLAVAWARPANNTTAVDMAETLAAMRELAIVEADKMLDAMRKGER